ncbi:hypothetical protein EYB25_005175 [Talaromyces marneffei]|nr:hypothetical protein EYB25_005175 [Talaromyces marneffei]
MHASFIILAVITSLSSSASAIGRVLVFNNCSFDVWPWSLDTIGENGILSRLRPEEQQAFPMNPQPGGSSVSVAVSPGALSSGAARTIFGYQLTETGVYYSLCNQFGDSFRPFPVSVHPLDGGQAPVLTCPTETRIRVTLCGGL